MSKVTEQNVQTAKTFDDYNEKYSDTVNNSVSFSGLDVDFFTKVKAEYLLDICKAHFADIKDISLLDVGCGVGNFHGLLEPHIKSLSGVDISEDSIKKASALHHNVSYKVYDGETLPFENNSFDLAFAICVVHHVPVDLWKNFLEEMYRIVKPGGLAVIFEHNPLNPFTMKVVNNCPFDADAVLLKSNETKTLFQNAHFVKIKRDFILTIPAFNRLFRVFDRFFSKLHIGAQYFVVGQKPK